MSFNREPNAEPIPGYRLIEPLGNGGFGEVWKCEAPGGVHKAVKFVFGNLDSLDVDGARAEQEQKALDHIIRVRHPFVLEVDRIDVVKGELVIVMGLADKSLHDAFEDFRSAGLVGVPRDVLLSYLRDAAEALDHMNEVHKLQHLDVKPRNLFIVSNRVKVADFGLVKTIERSGNSGMMSSVTPLYAPPETLKGEVSPHSDQYSLAIVYQEMLTGHRPFNGKNVRQLAQQHLNEPPDLRTLPESERAIVGRALAKNPGERFPSCLAFVRALYSSRVPTYSAAANGRPKTMMDTLESFQLGVPDDVGSMCDEPEVVDSAPGLNESNEAVGNLGVTVAQPSTGALRPTLIIGVGGFGRRAMMELRCRLLDRFGDLEKIPLFRFLYLDTDGDAVKSSQRGAAEIAFLSHEVFPLPLQAVSHYRRRQIEQLGEWLPQVKLYGIPRSLKTQGIRALGRLAFTDTYQRLIARLKRELSFASHPDAIYRSVSETGLALRDDVPRVYVLGSATGGGSGFLPDLGYTLRRMLQQNGQPQAPVVSFLFCGAPDDPTTPHAEQANLFATLTELNHFGSADVTFSAQYGMDGPRLRDQGPAFDQVYLLSQGHRTADDRRDALAHMGSYLFHELTTPLGPKLDQSRMRKKSTTPFRSLGTFGVWFPRGLMLRMAARDAVVKLMDEWRTAGSGLTSSEQSVLDAALTRVLTDPDLRADALTSRIDSHVAESMDATARQCLQKLLVNIEEQSLQPIALDDPGAWARQMLQRVQDWLGSGIVPPGVNVVQQRRSQLTRGLESASAALTSEWAKKMRAVIDRLTETPGRRIAVAEAAVAKLIRFCDESLQANQTKLEKVSRCKVHQEQVQQALQNCLNGTGGWSIFGGRSRRLVRVFVDHLAAFARQCLTDDLAGAVLHFYGSLRGRLADLLRDLGYAHKRLKSLQDTLTLEVDEPEVDENVAETSTFMRTPGAASGVFGATGSTGVSQTPLLSTESYWQAIRESHTARVVLPDGESDLSRSARRFLATLNGEKWQQLDQVLGDEVLSARGGLLRLCLDGGDAVRDFLSPMLNQAITCLSEHLPITDVAQVEDTGDDRLRERILGYHKRAVPALSRAQPSVAARMTSQHSRHGVDLRRTGRMPVVTEGPADPARNGEPPPEQFSFLLVPASDAGKAFGETARELLPPLALVNVHGQADLMFCREQGSLRLEDLEKILQPCRNAYHELCLTPQTSPHARFDIHDWTPLDP